MKNQLEGGPMHRTLSPAKECEADIVANCSGVKAGEGRVLQCLEKNEAKVSKRCKGAIKDVGLK